MEPSAAKPGDPYCGHCGYSLVGLTDSSKCPECGRPMVEVLMRAGQSFARGKRFRSRARLFGWPVIDIALGPSGQEMRGHARGIIAIGDVATGGVAIGGMATGLVAIGGVAFGLVAIGGMALSILAAGGGLAIGAFACGGGAIGLMANGGGAVGMIAQGGGAVGYWARGGSAIGAHVPPDASAAACFDAMGWFFGPWPPGPGASLLPLVYPGLAAVLIGTPTALLAIWKYYRDDGGFE